MTRDEISEFIVLKLMQEKEVLKHDFKSRRKEIGYFFIDGLLPNELALEIYTKFPSTDKAVRKKNLREFKFTAYQMDHYDSLLEDLIYAFQDEK